MAFVSWIVCAVSYKKFGISFQPRTLECPCTSALENFDGFWWKVVPSSSRRSLASLLMSTMNSFRGHRCLMQRYLPLGSLFSVKRSTKESAPFCVSISIPLFLQVSEVLKSIVVILFIIFTVKSQLFISTFGFQHPFCHTFQHCTY